MKLLLIGSGAREHALAWKLAESADLYLLPGNPGMARLGRVVEGVPPSSPGAVATVAEQLGIDFVVVGPEAPLAAGVVDALRSKRIAAFGPTRSAARLESSKAFAKEVMRRAGVPTAAAHVFDDPEPARQHLHDSEGPFVVKADGLAAGKGVLVTTERSEAVAWIDRCFDGGFGDAGARVVVEEYLEGPELSVFAICDGERFAVLEPARDYKRLRDGDAGPNTGGMGSFSPVQLPDGLLDDVARTVIEPTLAALRSDGIPYVGFLYAGLALTSDGPRVIEFNCRLGDPETQVVLRRMRSDLLPLLESAASGALTDTGIAWSEEAAVNVVMAAEGYPERPRSGDRITGLDSVGAETTVFHAGTARSANGDLVTSGGRVLSVVATGPTLASARERAYDSVGAIRFAGRTFRTDIGT